MPSIIAATTVILLIQNVLTRQYLTYNGSEAVMHSIEADPANFHFFGTNSHSVQYIQSFIDSSIKLGLDDNVDDIEGYLTPTLAKNTDGTTDGVTSTGGSGDQEQMCEANATIGSIHIEWYIEPTSAYDIVRLYVLDESGQKWYIRAHFRGTTIDFVCEDYITDLDNSPVGSYISKKEVEFNLVSLNVLDILM